MFETKLATVADAEVIARHRRSMFVEMGQADDDRKVPIFGITFGDADRSQLDALANATGARVFDGSKDLVAAFRSARGYN